MLLPAVKRGVAFLDGDKQSLAGRADLAAGFERAGDRRAVLARLDDFGAEMYGPIGRRRASKLDRIARGHGARRRGGAVRVHQMPRRGPV